MARNRVPIYSVHATSRGATPLRYVNEEEALALIEIPRDANGVRLRDKEGKPLPPKAVVVSAKNEPLKIQLTSPECLDGGSPCSISFQEALANVGISDKRGEHNYVSESRKRQVQAKVSSFQVPSWIDRVTTA